MPKIFLPVSRNEQNNSQNFHKKRFLENQQGAKQEQQGKTVLAILALGFRQHDFSQSFLLGFLPQQILPG